MPKALVAYVRFTNRISRWVGYVVMYSIFAMMGVLLYATYAKAFLIPPIWALEVSQFMMVAYFLLGGAYSLLMNAHVRMDLLYGTWQPRTRLLVDAVTAVFLIAFLVMLLFGGVSSTLYALEYGERSYSAWRPAMAPIKIVMCVGILLTLMQAVAILIMDVARLRGLEIDDGLPAGDPPT
ncbi:TRAP transporter small permease subunit [Azospirillum halopraeferens]|uniref:TRAP transporter small permease subunit n=1 Tax=Azospirillum halopraeferens TaxID=34010 RepID=UPI0004252064|nr:TRAP transporter small permease subunit [Azospirillum halopraeferens]